MPEAIRSGVGIAEIMIRFEDALASYHEPHLNLPALCSAIDVPERTLRMCSAELPGLSSTRYHLLRRLNQRAPNC